MWGLLRVPVKAPVFAVAISLDSVIFLICSPKSTSERTPNTQVAYEAQIFTLFTKGHLLSSQGKYLFA